MNYLRVILLFVGFGFQLTGYSQTDTIIKHDIVNLATLIVDFETYEFEGGDISYYSCANCSTDSIPFTIDYQAPCDFGGVTFTLSSTQETVFDATIVWMGLGYILYPNSFGLSAPFINANRLTTKPSDLKYIYAHGSEIVDANEILAADSAWNSIDSLEITNLFAENGFEATILLYTPTVGLFNPAVAKWIIFLYHYDAVSTANKFEETQLKIFPNPTNGVLKIDFNSINIDILNYRVFNQTGQLVVKGDFAGSDYKLDLSELNSGLYFLQLSDKNNAILSTEKIIVE